MANENVSQEEITTEAAPEEAELTGVSKSLMFPILKVNEAKQIVYGPVLVPDVIDLQKDLVPAVEVEKAAHTFMRKLVTKNAKIGVQHKTFPKGLEVVELWVTKAVEKYGKRTVPVGTWMMGVHVADTKVWKAVCSGEKKGFSIACKARDALADEKKETTDGK